MGLGSLWAGLKVRIVIAGDSSMSTTAPPDFPWPLTGGLGESGKTRRGRGTELGFNRRHRSHRNPV
jgi:hypothetical protein